MKGFLISSFIQYPPNNFYGFFMDLAIGSNDSSAKNIIISSQKIRHLASGLLNDEPPAATSQGFSPISKNPSSLPAAT